MIEFLLGVAAAVVAAFFLSLFTYGRSILSLRLRDLRVFWSVTRRMQNSGITNFFPQRADYIKHRRAGTIPDYVDTAKQELLYVGFWLAHGMEMSGIKEKLVELVKRGCYIEFVLIDPESDHISALADYLAMTPELLVSRASYTIEQMRSLRKSLPPESRPCLMLKTHTKLITASAFVIDRSEILMDFKLYDAARDRSFGIEFRPVPGPDSLHHRVIDSLMKIRESATPLDNDG